MKNKSLLFILFLSSMTIGLFMACSNITQKKEAPAINLADMDTSVDPGHDFDAYANGSIACRSLPFWVL